MTVTALDADVARLRAFNRFYTRRIGVLQERLLASDFTLPECRVLWELAHHDGVSAATLARELDLDPGYLSRLLRRLKERQLVRVQRSPSDGRESLLSLSEAGRAAFAPLDQRSQREMAALLEPLPAAARHRLAEALHTVEQLLDRGSGSAAVPPVPHLRTLQAGDLGWVIARHGALYAEEHGYDGTFEALVARIAADFVERFDASREAAWIAERGGVPLGSVFLVQARDDSGEAVAGTAQLRLLLVEPPARGLGLGRQLVEACEAFARRAGYRRITLWTQSHLDAARRLYAQAGYRCIEREPHTSFGRELVGERWERAL